MSLSSCKQKMYECLLQLCCFNAKHHSNWRLTAGYIKCVSLNVSWSELHRTTEALTNTILSAFIQYIHTHAVTHSYTQRCTLKKTHHMCKTTPTHITLSSISHTIPHFFGLYFSTCWTWLGLCLNQHLIKVRERETCVLSALTGRHRSVDWIFFVLWII